jgi:hypothetical protein
MKTIEDLKARIIDIMVQPAGYFKEESAINLLDELIMVVRSEERANVKLVATTEHCPEGCEVLARSICAYTHVCDLATMIALNEEHIEELNLRIELLMNKE